MAYPYNTHPFYSSSTPSFYSTNTTHTPPFPSYPYYNPSSFSTTTPITSPTPNLDFNHGYSPPSHNPYTSFPLTYSPPSHPTLPTPTLLPSLPPPNPYTHYSTLPTPNLSPPSPPPTHTYTSYTYESPQHSHPNDLQNPIRKVLETTERLITQMRATNEYYKSLHHSLNESFQEKLESSKLAFRESFQKRRKSREDLCQKFQVVLQKKLQENDEEEQEEQNDEEGVQPDSELQEDIEEELIEKEPKEQLDDEIEPDSAPLSIIKLHSAHPFKNKISSASTNIVMTPKAPNRDEQFFVDELLFSLTSCDFELNSAEVFSGEPPPPPKPPDQSFIPSPFDSMVLNNQNLLLLLRFSSVCPAYSLAVFVIFLSYFSPSDSHNFCKVKSQPLASNTICVLLVSDQSDAILSPSLLHVRTNERTTAHLLFTLFLLLKTNTHAAFLQTALLHLLLLSPNSTIHQLMFHLLTRFVLTRCCLSNGQSQCTCFFQAPFPLLLLPYISQVNDEKTIPIFIVDHTLHESGSIVMDKGNYSSLPLMLSLQRSRIPCYMFAVCQNWPINMPPIVLRLIFHKPHMFDNLRPCYFSTRAFFSKIGMEKWDPGGNFSTTRICFSRIKQWDPGKKRILLLQFFLEP